MYSMPGEMEIAPRRCAPGPGMALEIGEAVERKIHFAGGSAIFVASNAVEKIAGQFAGLQKFFEREMRIDAGRNDVGGYFFARFAGRRRQRGHF